MRNTVLIPRNIGHDCDINNHAYCVLERIGRSRHFGELTSGPFSINEFVKDSKLIHYFRNTLVKSELVVRQYIQMKIRGVNVSGQLFHLPRYQVLIRATKILKTEQLFEFLKSKPYQIAEIAEIRNSIKVKQKQLISLIKTRENLFEYNSRTLYRECYPDSKPTQYFLKKKNKSNENEEKTIVTVKLLDPSVDIFQLLQGGEDVQVEEKGFLDISNQRLNRPLAHQVCQKIDEAGKEGMSQLEIGTYFGITRLNSRSVVRTILRQRNISSYMKDEGRQRTTKFISKDADKEANDSFIAEMAKLLRKADESKMALPIFPMVISKCESIKNEKKKDVSPTKVSIPLSPSTWKFLKPEPSGSGRAIVFEDPALDEETPAQSVVAVYGNSDPCEVVVPYEQSSFVDNVENVTVNMRFLNSVPGIKKECSGLAKSIEQNRMSLKVLTRMNKILDFIKEKTVADLNSLTHLMREFEQDLPEDICRKSLLTLCGKLSADNFLKVIEMELKSETKTINLLYFGEPSFTFETRYWQSIIEEQKIQHFVPFHRRSDGSKPSTSTVRNENDEFGPQSKRYENFPKFMKMKLFHEFLFYLIYAYPSEHQKIPIHKAVEKWSKENPRLKDFEEITEKITNCYSSEISWKMFVSPLNAHQSYENGWALLRDVVYRMPLILFVKFTRIPIATPQLQKYLTHPIKCNYLLHFLPSSLREDLLRGRKYVFMIQELCKKLAWCGILQFGPSRSKEIDQTFIYLNRKASLLDTSPSDEGFLEVSDMEYREMNFFFQSPNDVNDYWNQMHEIAINTRINKKGLALGKVIEIEPIASKPALQEALKVQSPMSAPLNDLGKIPGDHKGAAGLDKCFMAHLKQSWSRPLERKKAQQTRAIAPSKSAPRSRPKKEKSTIVKEAASKIKNKVIGIVQSKFKSKKTSGLTSKIIRKVAQGHLNRQKALIAKDVVDKQAMKLMKSQRVSWSEVEDKTLLLIKVAMKVAFPIEGQSVHYVNASIIRDVLHWRTEKALNKTSKACTRRIQYLVKTKASFKEQIALYNEELRANSEFMTKYGNFVERLKQIYSLEHIYDAVKVHFVEIVYRIHKIFYKEFSGGESSGGPENVMQQLPSDYAELIQNYTITNPVSSMVKQKHSDPKNPAEAMIAMLMSLIHSAVCCYHDKTNYSQQLFEVYRKFQDADLTTAVSLLRRASVISITKKEKSKNRSILPYSFSPFHISTRYATQMMGIAVPIDLYEEYLQAIKSLSATDGSYQMSSISCGWIFMLSEMINTGKLHLSHDKVDKLVMVDPALRKKTNFDTISDNYLQLMNKGREGTREKKTVKLPSDKTTDEKFLFSDDPIEIFLKIDQVYLHAFCIISALVKGDNINAQKWIINDDGECNLKNCVIKDDLKFADNARNIADQSQSFLTEILTTSSSGTETSGNLFTKQNFVKFFDEIIEKHFALKDDNDRKDFSGKVMKPVKLATKVMLECILILATEPGLEEDSWIGEYKKVAHKGEDEGLDDEDLEVPGDPIKHSAMFGQLKDLNLSTRTSDSFVVNLSTIYVDLNDAPETKINFEGNDYHSSIVPFTEQDRAVITEKILSAVKFTPDDLEAKDLVVLLRATGIENTLEIMNISEVCNFIQEKRQMGATSIELLELFTDKAQLQKQIEKLIELKFIFRVGVIETRFIHKDFAAFWLLDSFYTTREDGSSDGVDSQKRKLQDTKDVRTAKKLKKNDCEPSTSKAAIEESAKEETKEPKKAPLIAHPLRVRPAPWIRVNGTLNHRVIDKWLGTILNHLTMNPCVLLSDLIRKFNILTPFDLRTLCENLQLLGCIEMFSTSENDVDLFSDYIAPDIGKLDDRSCFQKRKINKF